MVLVLTLPSLACGAQGDHKAAASSKGKIMAEHLGLSQQLSSNFTQIVYSGMLNSLSRASGFYYLKCRQAVHHKLESVHERPCSFYSLSPDLYEGKDFLFFSRPCLMCYPLTPAHKGRCIMVAGM